MLKITQILIVKNLVLQVNEAFKKSNILYKFYQKFALKFTKRHTCAIIIFAVNI